MAKTEDRAPNLLLHDISFGTWLERYQAARDVLTAKSLLLVGYTARLPEDSWLHQAQTIERHSFFMDEATKSMHSQTYGQIEHVALRVLCENLFAKGPGELLYYSGTLLKRVMDLFATTHSVRKIPGRHLSNLTRTQLEHPDLVILRSYALDLALGIWNIKPFTRRAEDRQMSGATELMSTYKGQALEIFDALEPALLYQVLPGSLLSPEYQWEEWDRFDQAIITKLTEMALEDGETVASALVAGSPAARLLTICQSALQEVARQRHRKEVAETIAAGQRELAKT